MGGEGGLFFGQREGLYQLISVGRISYMATIAGLKIPAGDGERWIAREREDWVGGGRGDQIEGGGGEWGERRGAEGRG